MRALADELPEAVAGRALFGHLSDISISPQRGEVISLGHMLQRMGFLAQAEGLFHGLACIYPADPAGLWGLAQAATQRRAWLPALHRWEAVIDAFPHHETSYCVASRARVLYEIGHRTEAIAILDALASDRADQPHGRIGLAQLAMRQSHWIAALEHWDAVLAGHPEHVSRPFTTTARAAVLAKLRRHAEAEAELRAVIQEDPWMIGSRATLMRVLAETGRYDEALSEPLAGIFIDAAAPILCHTKMGIQLEARRLDEARALFERYLHSAVDMESITHLFDAVPLLYENWRRTAMWIDLSKRLDALETRAMPDALDLYRLLRARIKLALKDHAGYLNEVRQIETWQHLREFESGIMAVSAALADPRFPDYGKQKIFGIGLSKTGTTSLASALTALGLSTLHWTNPLTGELVSESDLHLFDAHTDTPVSIAFEKYFHLFPAAKFIYTIRPLDTWLGSMVRHWRKALKIKKFAEFQEAAKIPGSFRFGAEFCAIHRLLYLNHANLQRAYEAHDHRVRRFFSDKPQDRFLVFNVFDGHGWQELCAFLGTPIPPIPFPFENSSAP